MLGQLKQYDELIGEYQLPWIPIPSVLVVVEKARASCRTRQPRRFMLLVATAVISFLFSFLLALCSWKEEKEEYCDCSL